MEILNVLFVLCGLPLAIFLAGWMACYLLVVKYRFSVQRRYETDQQPAGHRPGSQVEWQP